MCVFPSAVSLPVFPGKKTTCDTCIESKKTWTPDLCYPIWEGSRMQPFLTQCASTVCLYCVALSSIDEFLVVVCTVLLQCSAALLISLNSG